MPTWLPASLIVQPYSNFWTTLTYVINVVSMFIKNYLYEWNKFNYINIPVLYINITITQMKKMRCFKNLGPLFSKIQGVFKKFKDFWQI